MATKKKSVKKKFVSRKTLAKKKAVVRTRVNKKVAPTTKKAKDGTNRGCKKVIISKAMMKELESAAAIGCTYAEMSRAIGIDRDTLKRCREEQSGVQDLIDAAKARGCIKAKNKLYDVAVNIPTQDFKPVNMDALKYYLNNNSEFATQLEVVDGKKLPDSIDETDEEAVKSYMDMIRKPV